jgi:hypothetical protein
LGALIQYVGVFALVTLALNPLFWKNPIQAAAASWESRQDLLRRQTSDAAQSAPDQALNTPARRAAAMLANLYLRPPSFYEIGNYRDQTASSEQAYLAVPGHNLMRSIWAGGILFLMTLIGFIFAILKIRPATPQSQRRAIVLVALATIFQVAALLIWIPLPWQRYVIPVLPLVCLWTAYAPGSLVSDKENIP